MTVVAIIQARLGSTRFPKKVLKKIKDKTIIQFLVERLSLSKSIDQLIVAIPDNNNNKELKKHLNELNCKVFSGDENDVLSRYYNAALKFKSDIIIRITADCPLIDPFMLDNMVDKFINSKVDYYSNTLIPHFPDGMDIEIFNFSTLKNAYLNAKKDSHREHVTPYIKENIFFKKLNFQDKSNFSNYRITLDEFQDLEVINNVILHFYPKNDFRWKDIKRLIINKPNLFLSNIHIKRNEGAEMNTGQKLWKRAKNVIPGGNMLLSKRPEMFLPEKWPTYFSKAKGCKIWDLDGNEYWDMSRMAIGTNILGYGHDEVDQAVRETVQKGNMSTLNCAEEVFLAEKLIEIHPWAHKTRFARSGGEANAIAIRIARSASQKDNIAICGYHGWHDWYLAANLIDKNNLSDHLLPNLDPAGVPSNLNGSVIPFEYNNYEELEQIISKYNIGTIMMEVTRNFKPKNDFLKKVRKIANEKEIILIFDECSSGFRQTYGGIHKLYEVEPDMAMFGKTLGNGYAITAVIGKKNIMEATQNSFISSTFWTERIGPTAALKTLEVMEKMKSWEIVTKIGKDIGNRWKILSKKYDLDIQIFGIPACISFKINSQNWLKYKTLISQEMLKKGYLACNSVYASISHNEKIIDNYFKNLESIFSLIAKSEIDKNNIDKYLESPVCHAGFRRIN